MNRTIRIRIKKEIDSATENKIIQLKGILISRGFTDVIYFDDEDDSYHINSFSAEKRNEAIEQISSYITERSLQGSITIL